MVRPKRPRYIINQPVANAFIPDGIVPNGNTVLSLEEFEAIRLIDYEGLDQSQAADIMAVSRQTFGRILKEARYKLSEFIVEAQGLRVEGGCYRMHRKGHGVRRRAGGGHQFGKHGNKRRPGHCEQEMSKSASKSDGTDTLKEVTT